MPLLTVNAACEMTSRGDNTFKLPAVCSSSCVCQLLSTDSGHTISVARGPLTDGG